MDAEFQPCKNAVPREGMVLRVPGHDTAKFLRLTHVFNGCVYVMWVGRPEEARNARRPRKLSADELANLVKTPGATWGLLPLPLPLSDTPEKNSVAGNTLEGTWRIVRPLISSFCDIHNLSRERFTSLIKEHACRTQTSPTTLKRLVLRFYYFGGTKLALRPLPPGSPPESATPKQDRSRKKAEAPARRRGRQSVLAQQHGGNDFVVSGDDIQDMQRVYSRFCRNGTSTLGYAHDKYLSDRFRQRHPEEYRQYSEGFRSEPITLRQFRYYTIEARASDGNVQATRIARLQESTGALQASGPGEITEVDATGGRIFLVDRNTPPVCLGLPVIYIAIDRWSRFITGIYVSLKSASYDELRYLLLVCMTPREARFRWLNVNVNDSDWVCGRLSAVIAADHGSDFRSESTRQAVADDLRIELVYMPPLCPDAKAIVERAIGVLKQNMASKSFKGSYKARPLDPKSRQAVREAKTAAVHTLSELYRALVDLVIEHNNRPHTALRRRKILTQAHIQPTPTQAYLWGLENISGLRSPSLTDEDYKRMLLASGIGHISKGVCRFLNRSYYPANADAMLIAARSTHRSKEVPVRYDRTFPHTIFLTTPQHKWAEFRIAPDAMEELRGLSLDEEEALSRTGLYLWSEADTDARRKRVNVLAEKADRRTATKASASEPRRGRAREHETAEIKRRLANNPPAESEAIDSSSVAKQDDWQTLVQAERDRTLAAVRRQRKGK